MAPFDYSRIPVEYYDSTLLEGSPIRRSWHLQKFERILDCLPVLPDGALLDIGCFAGTFLSLIPPERFGQQLGVDILEPQIAYARRRYGTPYRRFEQIGSLAELTRIEQRFDCVSLIEVIEHLAREEIATLLAAVHTLLRPGGLLVLSTPNYLSAWPAVEFLINRLSPISYEEQHITKFTYGNAWSKLRRCYPALAEQFELEIRTTTHFITAFLSPLLSVEGARRMSRLVPHRYWRFPFGNLVVLGLRKR